MPADKITDGVARLAMISGAVTYTKPDAGPIVINAGAAAIPLPGTENLTTAAYFGTTDFAGALNDLSELLADASLSDPGNYLAFLAALDENRTIGHVLVRPAGRAVPDAAVSLVPWLAETSAIPASERIFPALPLLNVVSAVQDPDNPMDVNAVAAWCMTNPGNLIVSNGPAQSIEYTGWNASLGKAVSIMAVLVDFEKPWRISTMPDGSEEVVPAMPLKAAEPELGYWEVIQ